MIVYAFEEKPLAILGEIVDQQPQSRPSLNKSNRQIVVSTTRLKPVECSSLPLPLHRQIRASRPARSILSRSSSHAATTRQSACLILLRLTARSTSASDSSRCATSFIVDSMTSPSIASRARHFTPHLVSSSCIPKALRIFPFSCLHLPPHDLYLSAQSPTSTALALFLSTTHLYHQHTNRQND